MSIQIETFGTLPDGREAKLYTLRNKNGMTLVTTDYGCRIVKLLVKDKDGQLGDVVLGHRTLPEYYGSNYQGATVGRYANRIGEGDLHPGGQGPTPLAQNDGRTTPSTAAPGATTRCCGVAEVTDGDEPSLAFTHTQPRRGRGLPRQPGHDRRLHPHQGQQPGAGLRRRLRPRRPPITPPTTPSSTSPATPSRTCSAPTSPSTPARGHLRHRRPHPRRHRGLPVAGRPPGLHQPQAPGPRHVLPTTTSSSCAAASTTTSAWTEHGLPQIRRGLRARVRPGDGGLFRPARRAAVHLQRRGSGLTGKDGKPMKPHTAFCLETQFYPDSVNHD